MSIGLKICGITRADDLDACARAGVEAVGLNFWTGSRRGISPEQAQALLDAVPAPSVRRVGVFVTRDPSEVAAIAKQLRLDAIQWHGDRSVEPYAALGLPLVWVVRGTPQLSLLSPPVPAPVWVLLDAAVPGFGGAGQTTDWAWAARAVRHFAPLPVWLAGGIHPGNARQAIAQVGPAGLDVASGAELEGGSHGAKDPEKIAALVAAVRA